MISALLTQALRHRWFVLIFAVVASGGGVWSYLHQKVDAYPDISAQMVEVITTYPGYAPEEIERQVTIPIELAMGNVPRVNVIRSRTIFGLSLVQLEFEEDVEGYWARQRVLEKLATLTLPPGAQPALGAYATAYGEIYRYEIRTDGTHDLMELRTLNDWVVIPRLLRTPGVADVSNFGGLAKQFTATVKPQQLERFGLQLSDVTGAISTNNSNGGGSVVNRGSMSFVVRGRGLLQTLSDVGSVFIKTVGGTPVYVRDVATVEFGHQVPFGIFSKDKNDNTIEGVVLLLKGENPSEVLGRVQAAVEELNTTRLPAGVRVHPFYDRSYLVQSTLRTVAHSVLAGITLVVLILLIFLGSPKMAVLVALTIPFSLLFALILTKFSGIPIGLLSVGAIDFGIIVDGAVIMADNIAHRLSAEAKSGRRWGVLRTVHAAALEVERPIFFSVLIIIAGYVPLLSLTHIEGLLFRPMALTLVFALAGAVLFSLFVAPALAVLLFPNGYEDHENPLLRRLRPLYGRTVVTLLKHRWKVLLGVAGLLFLTFFTVLPRLGTEFLPYLDEGVVWVRVNFPEGMALEETAAYGKRLREICLEFPDVKFAVVQAGRNDSGTDPFPPSRIEMMIAPRPQDEWSQISSKTDLVEGIGKRFRDEFPTCRFNFTQPIIDSVTEDANGTSANLAVDFSGDDSLVLLDLAKRLVDLLRKVPGAVDVSVEQEGPQPQLIIRPDRALAARHNVRMDDVNLLINTALGGAPVTQIYEGERRFDVVVKFGKEYTRSPEAIGRLPVFSADGLPIPLSQLADIRLEDGQTLIARESGHRRLTVRCDIVGRDQGGFVSEAQDLFQKEMKLPDGYEVSWLGMFENLDRAKRHFGVLVPLTVALIFILLLVTLKSFKAAGIVILSVPFAFAGGALALAMRGMHLNVSSAIGCQALFGVAIMDGVLMVRWITNLRIQGLSVDEAIVEGAKSRLRPVLMTSIVAILGLLPAALATDLGSDVQRPLATVIVCGLVSSTILTLFVVPVLYRIVEPGLPSRTIEEDDDLSDPVGEDRPAPQH
ncbi:MAG TPA: CusA/CzcA family heavy metal efflux RND transporter [Planctomycetota bacterium]|nr:CusA/CzcA family heavy metal efflux RND transporter [Planctomycetota bacterium]